jgi:hypothetical protein
MSPSPVVDDIFQTCLRRYDGANIVSRSMDLNQPVIFVSMNYRWAFIIHFMHHHSDTGASPVSLVCFRSVSGYLRPWSHLSFQQLLASCLGRR